jgi:predicted PurR-regulated permease PerM
MPIAGGGTTFSIASARMPDPASAGESDASGPSGAQRCWACTGVFILALVAALSFGAPLLLPIVLAVLFNLLLSPAVRGLRRIGVPLPLGALLVLLVMVALIGTLAWRLAAPATAWVERAPAVMRDIQAKLRPLQKSVQQVQKATEEVEKAARVSPGAAEIRLKGPSLLDQAMTRAQDILVGAFMMLVLLYFLMASDDFFLRKVVRVLPTLRDKIKAVEIGRNIEVEIGRYFVSYAMISAGVGVAVTIIAWATGLPTPPLWGVIAGILNFVPYLGPATSLTVIATVSVLTFDSPARMALPPLLYLAVETVEGNVIQPLTFGRSLSLNPVAIFVSLLFWGWLWGPAGILLAVPILVVIKVTTGHIEATQGIAEFLDRK